MTDTPDAQLLEQFARNESEAEQNLNTVVVDQTRLYTNLDIDFQWPNKTPGALKQALLDQAGLKLTPDVQDVKFIAVDPAK